MTLRAPLLLLLLALPALAEDPPLKGVKACNRAVKLMEEGKPAEALAVLEAAKGTMDAKDEWVWWGNCGMAHWDLRSDDKALAELRKAVELNKECWFRVPCANLLHEFGKYDDALAMLDGPIDPDYAERAQRLRVVIDGPYRKRWPRAFRKLEYSGKVPGHYCVVSDVGVDSAEMDRIEADLSRLAPAEAAQRLQPDPELVKIHDLLERSRREFLRLTGVTEAQWPEGKVFRVFVLKSQEEFLRFAQAAGGEENRENVLGFYDPNFKYVQLFNKPGSTGLHSETLDTFWHEGWHQVFDALTSQRPVWLNEGIAEFLGKGEVTPDGSGISLGLLVKGGGKSLTRYERIREVIAAGKHVKFREFFHLDREKWDSGDVPALYAQAWSVVYYAKKGDNESFRADFAELLQELLRGTEWRSAVNRLFPAGKLERYEAEWRAWVDALE